MEGGDRESIVGTGTHVLTPAGACRDAFARARELRSQPEGSNTFDPYFLSNSGYPGMQLVTALFDGTKFRTWSRNIKTALGAKMKLGFINRVFAKPDEDSKEFDRWDRCDCMVHSWVINSMISDMAQNFVYATSAKVLWDELVEQYAESNAPMIYQLQYELNKIKQDNLSVAAYYTKLKQVWDELQAIDGTPLCSCGALAQCGCALMKRVVDRETTMKLMQFLMGLSDAYDGVRSTILSTTPLPYVNRAYHTVLQIERQKTITGNALQAHDALAINRLGSGGTGKSYSSNKVMGQNGVSSYTPYDSNRGTVRDGKGDFTRDFKKAKFDRKCSYCQENGHVRETCFKFVGYPEWWRGPRTEIPNKMMANIHDVSSHSSPLEMDDRDRLKTDSSLVNVVVQEVIKAMKGKTSLEDSSCQGAFANTISFAGPYN